jgi:hypothetical protein
MFYLEVTSSREIPKYQIEIALVNRRFNFIIEVPVKVKDDFVFKEIGNMNNNAMYH